MIDSSGQFLPTDNSSYQQLVPEFLNASIPGDLVSFAVVSTLAASLPTCYFCMLISIPDPLRGGNSSSGENTSQVAGPQPQILLSEGGGQGVKLGFIQSFQGFLSSALPTPSQSLFVRYTLNPVLYQSWSAIVLLLEVRKEFVPDSL
jgi:hypothetical protein